MIISITFPSALQFWLSASSLRLRKSVTWVRHLPEVMAAGRLPIDELQDIAETYDLQLPLHIAVPGASHRSKAENIYFHTLHKAPPENGYVQLSDNIFISTPELSLIEASKYLSFHRLVQAGTDLCANYVRNKNSMIFQSKRDPVTTPQAILNFAAKTSIPGSLQVRKAAKYILSDSNSPVETELGILCRLKMMYGGYAVDKPELNLLTKFSTAGAEYLHRETCHLDIGWKKAKVGLEYDSTLMHLNSEQHSYDKRRATALSLSGYKIMYITADQINSFGKVETIMSDLRKLLGLHPRKAELDKYMELRRRVVSDLLFEKSDEFNLFHVEGENSKNSENNSDVNSSINRTCTFTIWKLSAILDKLLIINH